MSTFHSDNGWYWTRLADGRIQVRHNDRVEMEIGPNVWASLVASMSLQGETLATFEQMQMFHTGTVSRNDVLPQQTALQRLIGEWDAKVPASEHATALLIVLQEIAKKVR